MIFATDGNDDEDDERWHVCSVCMFANANVYVFLKVERRYESYVSRPVEQAFDYFAF